MKTLKLLLLSLLSHSCAAKNVLDLTTHSWTLSNDALNISVPASLPSQAHLDLFAAGVIGDPYHDLNDFNLRWVALSNWTYSSGSLGELSRKANGSGNSSDSSSTTSTWLLFDGLDTFASIELCGRHVASTNNQFRQWWIDVTEIVDGACANGAVLSMNFGSAPKIADQIAGEPGVETWPYGV
jgi:beta-mannosidase